MNHIRLVSCFVLYFFGATLAFSNSAYSETTSEADAEYVKRFQEKFPPVDPAPALAAYATPAKYDELFMGERLSKALEKVSNNQGGIAWGLADRMTSLNEMFRNTEDTKYLQANLECIRAVLAARDDRRGVTLWTGKIAPAWSSDKYAERGRAVFAVHTGMILYPILDFLSLTKGLPEFKESLGAEFETILHDANETLVYHDRQWRDGPSEQEGHYIGVDQENVLEGKPLPGNRLSAMGRALWMSWKVSGNDTHRDRAVALGRYIRNRLYLGSDGAYYWAYWLTENGVGNAPPPADLRGEDASHASLTITLPALLAAEGQVFTSEDSARLCKTVTNVLARLDNGVLFGDVAGRPTSNPNHAAHPADWLRLSPFRPDVYERLSLFYTRYQSRPNPLDIALLIRYRSATP
ncbi:MAG: hypothetical protein HY706_13195 [Candidatus Hydrogenedentes bacterium]|nr:hypothetical protein [Candidatus Hydrogenedentota bacterium]